MNLLDLPSAADLYILRHDNTERQECTLCNECGAIVLEGLGDLHKTWHERILNAMELLSSQVGNLR